MSDTSSDLEDGAAVYDSDEETVSDSGGFSLDSLMNVTEKQLQNLEKLQQTADPPKAPEHRC